MGNPPPGGGLSGRFDSARSLGYRGLKRGMTVSVALSVETDRSFAYFAFAWRFAGARGLCVNT